MGPQHEEEEQQQQTQKLNSLLLSCPGHAVEYFSIYTQRSPHYDYCEKIVFARGLDEKKYIVLIPPTHA